MKAEIIDLCMRLDKISEQLEILIELQHKNENYYDDEDVEEEKDEPKVEKKR